MKARLVIFITKILVSVGLTQPDIARENLLEVAQALAVKGEGDEAIRLIDEIKKQKPFNKDCRYQTTCKEFSKTRHRLTGPDDICFMGGGRDCGQWKDLTYGRPVKANAWDKNKRKFVEEIIYVKENG